VSVANYANDKKATTTGMVGERTFFDLKYLTYERFWVQLVPFLAKSLS
jgi:hypothetical protein